MRVTLEGKTKKGKESVKREGSEWLVKESRSKVSFNSEKGIWFLLINESSRLRWVHENMDKDFIMKFV